MKPVFAEVDAARFLAELCGRFALEAQRRRIEVSCSSAPGLAFEADSHLLHRAATNVLQNAFQHVADGGRIGVAMDLRDGMVSIRIENTGAIPEDEIPRVFDRLHRGEHSRHAPGSGLGLTIARAVLDLHGGSIGIANSGRGHGGGRDAPAGRHDPLTRATATVPLHAIFTGASSLHHPRVRISGQDSGGYLVVALKVKHLAIAVPAIFALLIGLAMAFRVWDMPGRRFSDLAGRFGAGGTAEASDHDASDRIVRGTTTFQDLADWGLDDDAVRRLVGGIPAAPKLTVREWCAGKGIGFGTVKGTLQALVDAAGS